MKNTINTQQSPVLAAEAADKKQYIAPAMEVIELEKHSPILAASSGNGGMQDYNTNEYSEE